MKTMLMTILSALSLSAFAHYQEVDFTPQQRKQMAEMHRRAAECLNSNKTMQECRQEMTKNCPMAKDGYCPGMGMGMHPGMGPGMMGPGSGMGMGPGMMGTAPTQTPPKSRTSQ